MLDCTRSLTDCLRAQVTSADFDPTSSLPGDEGWLYAPVNGNLIYANKGVQWAGQQVAAEGDLIGMLLDLDVGTLTVFLNGQRLGVMVRGRALQRGKRPSAVEGEPPRAEEAVPPGDVGMDLRAHLPNCELCRQHPALFCLPADGMRRRWCAPCAAGIRGAANPHTTLDEAAGRPAAGRDDGHGGAEDGLGGGMNELLRRRRALEEDERRQHEERTRGSSGALCWCVDLGWEGGVVSIVAKGPPG